MRAATKVAFNTIVLYIKIVVSMAIALVSVPMVLKALGASDYGLYNLVAGVVAMLSFLNNSMTVSSQRYMSVAMGTNNEERVNIVYNTSFWLHLLLGIAVVVILECAAPFISKLNILPERIAAAQIIYQFLVLSTFSKIVSVPFDAIINAHEDMLTFSVIELIDSLLMLVLAFSLQYIIYDKLVFYGVGVLFIALLTLLMKYIWTRIAYKKYKVELGKFRSRLQTKEMFGFAGWNMFGGLAMIGRNQGVAIVINMFMGTIANAAYGISNQINGALGHFSSTFQKAINPQLMKSEGMNNRDRLLRMAYISSKFSVLALCFFAIPLIVEMDDVLSIWLKDNIPPDTVQLSCCVILLSIAYQFSTGIMSAVQAVGKIRNYQITMGIIILLNVPLSFFIIKAGYPIYYATACFVVLEVISLFIRLYYGKKLAGMPPVVFGKKVILPVLIIVIVPLIICLVPHYYIGDMWVRLIATSTVYGIIYLVLVWFLAFEQDQRLGIIKKIQSKTKNK